MRDYELTLVFGSDLALDDQKNLQTKIKKFVSDSKGEVKKADEWGKKEFTYPIKKSHSGNYFLWLLTLPEESIKSLDKILRQEEKLLRYLLVRIESPTSPRLKGDVVRGRGGKNGPKVAK